MLVNKKAVGLILFTELYEFCRTHSRSQKDRPNQKPAAGTGHYRDLLLFVVGINTALRISDLLRLQIGHVLDENKNIRRRFWIKERKRGKRHEVVINESMCAALEPYIYQIITV